MRCPECGATLIEHILTSNPPQYEYSCAHACGYEERYFNRADPFERRNNEQKRRDR